MIQQETDSITTISQVKKLFFDAFALQKNRVSAIGTIGYALLAYSIVVFIRLLFLKNHQYDGSIFFGSDGGLYGYYAKELLSGFHFNIDREHLPAFLLLFMKNITHLPLDKVIFYSPAFLSSLSVVPVILIGYAYNLVKFSFFVSIVGSLTYAYYTRSFIGYYDTDILNVTLSNLILSFMILLVEKKDIKYIYFLILSVALFAFWYHSSKLIIWLLLANFSIYLLLLNKKRLFKNRKIVIFVIIVITLLGIFNENRIVTSFQRGEDYIFKTKNIDLIQKNGKVLYFKSTLQTVSEAQGLKFDNFGKYYSLPNWYFYISILSLVIFSFMYKSFFLSLPLIFISVLSLKAGVRFSEYAVLVIAFGSVYFLYIVRNVLYYYNFSRYIVNIFFSILLFSLLYHYIYVVQKTNLFLHHKFTPNSIRLLKNFDKQLTKDDFIVTWWDIGWILWYYTKANTLIDNAKHFEDNYIVSKLFFSDQDYTAKASRYFLKENNNRYSKVAKRVFAKNSIAEVDKIISKSKSKEKHKKIYFLFYTRMIKILNVISKFGDINLKNGHPKNKIKLYSLKINKIYTGTFYVKNGKLNIKEYSLYIKNKKILLRDIYKKNRKGVIKFRGDKNSNWHVIVYDSSYLIICNDLAFHSFILQAMILDNYNKKLFRLVGKTKQIKILESLF